MVAFNFSPIQQCVCVHVYLGGRAVAESKSDGGIVIKTCYLQSAQ